MSAPGRSNRVRIIGGSLRGRKLGFSTEPGLRPTGDRIRETLFNWLQPALAGARCLDLFAGSGALGLEAISRGCGHVVMVDRSPSVISQLDKQLRNLGISNANLHRSEVPAWLTVRPEARFDIVFLDPPYSDKLLQECCDLLEGNDWLNPGALIYLEADAAQGLPSLPAGWKLIRDKTAGQVRFGLARRSTGTV